MELDVFANRQMQFVRRVAAEVRTMLAADVLYRIAYHQNDDPLERELAVCREVDLGGVGYARGISARELRREINHPGSFRQ